jgi:hypothetical protein
MDYSCGECVLLVEWVEWLEVIFIGCLNVAVVCGFILFCAVCWGCCDDFVVTVLG